MKKNEEYLDPDIIADLDAIENDEIYKNTEIPPGIKLDLFSKIAEYEQAEAEGNKEKIKEIRASVGMEEELKLEETKELNYQGLSEEDQQALRLGQELLRMQREQQEAKEQLGVEESSEMESHSKNRGNVRRFGKKKKVLLLVAIMITMMAGFGIVSVGDDMRWLVSEDKEFEENIGVVVNSDVESRKDSGETDEENQAYELADEVIGVPVVHLGQGAGLDYRSVEVVEDNNAIYMYYEYEQNLFQYSIMTNKNKISYFEVNDIEVEKEYSIKNEGVKIKIQVGEDTERKVIYASYTYNNVYYVIKCTMEEEIVQELLENLNFY